jgi:hypothetical protein
MQKFKSKILKTNGEQIEVAPKAKYFSLSEMQEIVGGNIEMVFLKNNLIMVVNEEGKLDNLPLNATATLLMMNSSKSADFIVGNVLVTNRNYIN